MISFAVEFTFAAEVEALQAFFWYETVKRGFGEDFKASVDSKIELLQQNPKAYSFIYKDIRSAKIKTFPYNLIYRVFDSKIQIIAIFHHSRNPREWKKRI
ncbi:MAG: type II toxin-antitoxin system RelE/ParE family toxin [Ginsengibacter sp.]